MNKRKIGIKNEEKAINYLIEKNYKIITKNYSNEFGEIDIICISKLNILVFVEVKYSKSGIIDPIYKLNNKKLSNIKNTSNKFINMYNYNSYQVQYDYIGIINKKLEHYENIINF